MPTNLIIGAGAVGTVLAAYLTKARQPVKLYVREQELQQLQGQPQLRLERANRAPPLISPAPPLTTALSPQPGDNLFICVKHPDLQSVIDELNAFTGGKLAEGVRLIPCLNGVGIARRLRNHFANADVAHMTVMFNAQLLQPLHAQIRTKPVVFLDTDKRDLLNLFKGSDLNVKKAAGEASAWGKLLINLNNAVCALTHTTFKDMLCDADMRALFVEILDEAVAVLDSAGIKYRLPVPLPYSGYRMLMLHAGPMPWWFAKYSNGLSDQSYPSMVADVERGRPTEINQLNGEIVRLGEQQGVDTPINRRLVNMIQDKEKRAEQSRPLTPAGLRAALESPDG